MIYRVAEFPIGIIPVNSTTGTTSPGHTTRNWFLAQLGFSASDWPVSWLDTDDDRGYARKHAAGTSRCERRMITDIWRVGRILRGDSTDTSEDLMQRKKVPKKLTVTRDKFSFSLRSNA